MLMLGERSATNPGPSPGAPLMPLRRPRKEPLKSVEFKVILMRSMGSPRIYVTSIRRLGEQHLGSPDFLVLLLRMRLA